MRRRGYPLVRKALLAAAGVALGLAAAAAVLFRTRAHPISPERPGCQAGPTTPGIDVSYHQETIDWPRVRRAGIRFAFIRLSDGERAQAWIDRVRDQLGVEPIVYTGSDLWHTGGAEPLASQALWLAHYTQGCPKLPAPWTRWTFWQHTDRGAIPGIEGSVDLDLFAGTLGELRALW